MNLIAAVDRNWAIGKKGQMLVKIPSDQKLFHDETIGKVIIMGRKTLESLPSGRPLYGRTNIILSKNKDYQVKGALVFHDLAAVLAHVSQYLPEDIFVIGGEEIYQQFLPYCQTAHITKIDYAYLADTYCPDLDQMAEWQLAQVAEEETYFDLCYEFRMYVRSQAD